MNVKNGDTTALKDAIVRCMGKLLGVPRSALDLANEIHIDGMGNEAKVIHLVETMNEMVNDGLLRLTYDPKDRRSYSAEQKQYEFAR